MTAKLPWFRLYTDFVSDPKLQLLAFEDQRHFVAVLCLKRDGTLDADYSSDELRSRVIAVKLGLSVNAADEAKRRLWEVDLVDLNWQPIAWEKRQFESDSSAERTRNWRAKKAKENTERHGDVTVTPVRRHKKQIQKQIQTQKEQQLRSSSVGDLSPSPLSTAPPTALKATENRRALASLTAATLKQVPR